MSQHGLYGLQDLGWGVEVTDTSGTACWALGEQTQGVNTGETGQGFQRRLFDETGIAGPIREKETLKKWQEGAWEAVFGCEGLNPKLKAKGVSHTGEKESWRRWRGFIGCGSTENSRSYSRTMSTGWWRGGVEVAGPGLRSPASGC